MTDLTDHIMQITTQRPPESSFDAPRRRSTFTPVAGPRVTVWRILSKDPDHYEDNLGVLVDETYDHYFVQVDGEQSVSRFEKRSDTGVIRYRLLMETKK